MGVGVSYERGTPVRTGTGLVNFQLHTRQFSVNFRPYTRQFSANLRIGTRQHLVN